MDGGNVDRQSSAVRHGGKVEVKKRACFVCSLVGADVAATDRGGGVRVA